ncbi:MAG: bifunctional DNA-formamidopyrimidine glycosylase/DNA-(apurinic or apyrimidinic site) lyase [bacterium]|nr:bifunctional DNA-formamidopyrimidine glycosylase/DNA-(apurinic or apyrimidinic site) lyase [bacterium]
MPELPEVETIKNDLLKKVVGSQITSVSYTSEGQKLISKAGQDLTDLLPGNKIKSIERKAKYLVLELSGGKKLIFHLKLTGRILVRNGSNPNDEFVRLVLALNDGREIRFADRNGFGEVKLIGAGEEVDQDLGPDPFEVSVQQFNLLINQTGKETIKETLLDQKTISGVGNIYADEALYLAGINPFRSPRALSTNETAKLLDSIKQVLNEGIKHRGTTIDSYRDTDGRPGTHQFHLLVYGKAGKPCKKCATRIEYTEIKGRRTHFCPNCQPKEQLALF